MCASIIGFIIINIIHIYSGYYTVYSMDEIQEFINVTKKLIQEFKVIIK